MTAVAVAILDSGGEPVAGLSVSVPPERFSALVDSGLVGHLQQTKDAFEADLRDLDRDV